MWFISGMSFVCVFVCRWAGSTKVFLDQQEGTDVLQSMQRADAEHVQNMPALNCVMISKMLHAPVRKKSRYHTACPTRH
jgi:hypothetical protein